MIISCPNCGAKYQVAVGMVMRRPKLKCAECSHRWVPADEIDEDEAVAAVQEELRAAKAPAPAPEPPPEPAPALPDPPPSRRAPVLKWLVALALGAAFTTGSIGLWVGRIDPERLPLLAGVLTGITPATPPLEVALAGQVTRVPGGTALLEVTGTITNRTTARVAVPPLNARLLVGGQRVRDWTIPPPAPSVGASRQLSFASSLTDVPEGQAIVQVRFGR